jgi:outer membrane protein assembly factor BamB/enterochelin esterase-like enzyme
MKPTIKNFVLLWILFFAPYFAFGDWPSFRGSNTDGVANSGTQFAKDAAGSLKVTWVVPAGSGYSGVSISNGIAVTGFSDGKNDLLAAFDEKTGKELWKIAIAPTYIGHDGSQDGPIATPAIADGKVFALAPRGEVISVDLRTGKKIWEIDLAKNEGAEPPLYGFGSSPLVSKGVLILQVGAKEKFLGGFDPGTGKKLWAIGNDVLNYQSPAKIHWKNQEIVVASGDTKIFGIDPSKGQILFEYAHEGAPHPMAAQSMIVVPAGEGQMLLKNKPDSSSLIRLVSSSDGKITVEKVWTAPVFKTTYSIPVYHDGHFYGFNGRVLSCVNAADGQIVWRTRAVGDGFPMIVDGNLVVQTKDGSVYIGPASPQGWTERAKVDLSAVSWTPPSFSSDAIFARGMKQVARIEWQKQIDVASTSTPPVALSTRFSSFLAEIEKATDKNAMIEKFFSGLTSVPYVEWPNHVYFLYRGDAQDLGISGDMIGARQEEPMNRIPETDLFWFHAQLEPDALITYRFVKNYEEQIADPKNPRKTKDARGQDLSIFTMPGWKDNSFSTQAPQQQRGVLESKEIVSSLHKGVSVKVDVYLPPGYKTGKDRYPLLIVLDGSAARTEGFFTNALDHLINRSVKPAITVFVGEPNLGEISLRDPVQYYEVVPSFLGKEVVKYIDQQYRTKPNPEDRAIIGNGFSGLDALITTLKNPGLFGAFGSQSLVLIRSDEELLRNMIKTAQQQPLQIYLDWGLYDLRTSRESWDIREGNRNMVQLLRERGYKPAGGETHESFGWASWRNRLDRVLVTLLPVQ